jgi:hypothetical protein
MRWLFAAVGFFALMPAARAAEQVDLELVLVTDVSRSIDDSEFELEKHGYAAAFSNPGVIAAIRSGAAGTIAVNYIEFASADQVSTVLDWMVIRDEASAHAFVDRLLKAERSARGRTAIGAGIELGLKNLQTAPFQTQRRVIDVCGDGTNNAGPDVTLERDAAVEAGVTVNGLAINNEHPASWAYAHVQPPGGLQNYYRENVAGGPGSFVLGVNDFAAFEAAVTRKLLSEIASAQHPRPAPHG